MFYVLDNRFNDTYNKRMKVFSTILNLNIAIHALCSFKIESHC